ncbi:MAG: histidine triad protein [Patescibacteria group bacterium]|nr:MAG: histidine triad protein [Patescibacteria group bacterium]
MKDCIFCKIASKKIPAEIIYEDSDHISFLDINPTTEGMTLVIPKKHYDSDIYSNQTEVILALMSSAKNTALLLKERLKPLRVLTLIEGLDVQHLHIKLYPFYGDKSPRDTLTKHLDHAPTKEELKKNR